jgi:hypothetical protein
MHSPHSATAGRGRQDGRRQAVDPRPRPSPLLRRLVEERVAELHAAGCGEELSRVLAREFEITEELADWIVAGLLLEHRTAAATLRMGVLGAVDEEARARKAVWDAA